MKRWRSSVVGSLVAAAALLAWPGGFGGMEASAADGSVKALVRLANSENGVRSLDAMERLRRLGTRDSERALEALCDSGDRRVAMHALSALARSGDAGAQQKLESVYRDVTRSDVVRAMALTAWCERRRKEGAQWEDLRAVAEAGAGTNAALLDTAACIQKARFATKEAK